MPLFRTITVSIVVKFLNQNFNRTMNAYCKSQRAWPCNLMVDHFADHFQIVDLTIKSTT